VSDGALVRELPDGGQEFVLEDPALSRLALDGRVHLRFGSTDVTVSAPFELDVDGVHHRLDPLRADTLTPLLATYPGTARWLWSPADGSLHLEFMQGQRLVVPGHPAAPAWSVGSVTAHGSRPVGRVAGR
jgi:hypothetical protein